MATEDIDPPNFYVYEILVDGIVVYIGKGTRRRVQNHISFAKYINRKRANGSKVKTQKFYNKLAKAIRSGSEISYRIVESGLTEDAAFEKEIEIIALFKDKNLWNVLPGGQGANSEHFKRLWRTKRNEYLSRMRSPEAIKALKDRVFLQWQNDAAREKNRQRTIGHWADPELREKRIAAMRAADNSLRRKRISDAAKKRWADPAGRAKYLNSINREKLSLAQKRIWAERKAKCSI